MSLHFNRTLPFPFNISFFCVLVFTFTQALPSLTNVSGPQVVEALLAFKEVYGHMDVPANFVVPSGSNHFHEDDDGGGGVRGGGGGVGGGLTSAAWPPSVWKMRLGQRVAMMRCRSDFLPATEPASTEKRCFKL